MTGIRSFKIKQEKKYGEVLFNRRRSINFFHPSKDKDKVENIREKKKTTNKFSTKKIKKKTSLYGNLLKDKQKIKYIYCIKKEKELFNLYKKCKKNGDLILQNLELNLSNVVYRLGFAKTRSHARQLVCHRHILVNGKIVNISSYKVKKGDIVSIKASSSKSFIVDPKEDCLAGWLSYDHEKKIAKVVCLPKKEDFNEKIKISSLISIYSR